MKDFNFNKGKGLNVDQEPSTLPWLTEKFSCIKFSEWVNKDHFNKLQNRELDKVKKKFIDIQKTGFDFESNNDFKLSLDHYKQREKDTFISEYPKCIKQPIKSLLGNKLRLHFGVGDDNHLYLIFIDRGHASNRKHK